MTDPSRRSGHSLSISADIQQAKQDARALAKLLDRYRGWLFIEGMSRRREPPWGDAPVLELVEGVIDHVFDRFDAFTGETEPALTSWIVTVFERHYASLLLHDLVTGATMAKSKSWSTFRGTAQLGWYDTLTNPQRVRHLKGEKALALATAVFELPVSYREAVRLRHLEGLSLASIAMRLNKPQAFIGRWLRGGLELLSRQVAALQEDETL